MLARLSDQMKFIEEIDQLKSVQRKTSIVSGERRENSAEHSWHLAVMALILDEHADASIDVLKVLKLVLIHDIVEIDSGDTYAFSRRDHLEVAENERSSAQRIFGLLPDDQRQSFIALWEEFNTGVTAEAKFANSLDRIMPLIHNFLARGTVWQENSIHKDQVVRRMAIVQSSSHTLWDFCLSLISEAVERGYLQE